VSIFEELQILCMQHTTILKSQSVI